MLDSEQGSLSYLMSRPADGQWGGFLGVLAEELSAQMPASETKAFLAVLGRRWARRLPLATASDLKQLEKNINTALSYCNWGWVQVVDLNNCVEFRHSCAPLRKAFGDEAMVWASGLLEGLYEEWLREQGAGRGLVLRQVGRAEGAADTLSFRLANADYFA